MAKTSIASNLDGQVREFERLTGVAVRQVVKEQDLDSAVLQRGLNRAGEFKVGVRELFTKLVREFPWPSFLVVINYALTLAQMITAGGYDWVNPDITAANFPVSGRGKVKRNTYLVNFDKIMSSEAILQWLDQQGLRAATIEELLAFGAKYREEQLKYTIVALGSSVVLGGFRDVPYLRRHSTMRRLSLDYFECDWDPDYRFLAVCK